MSETENKEKKSGKSGWSKFLSNFVTIEEDSKEPKSENKEQAPANAEVIAQSPVNILPPSSVGVIDQELYGHLLSVIEDKDLEGVDYLEFVRTKKNMDSIQGMNEQTKYQSAYAGISANSDVTKAKLLDTADFYIGILDEEAVKFNETVETMVDNEVVARQNKINALKEENSEKVKMIEQLTADINGNNDTIAHTEGEITENNAKIQNTSMNFQATITQVKNQIEGDKQKIGLYIQ